MANWENNPNSCYIIAEAGVNHNGDIEMAKLLTEIAAEAGADAVKFQTFKAEKVISKHAPKAEYQKKTTNEIESQLDMVKSLELDEDAHRILIEHCQSRNVEFLCTPFDLDSIDLLAHKLNLPRIKIPSGEITNGSYLLHVAKTGKPVILSTGMSTLGEVETALSVLAFGYLAKHDKPSLEKFRDAFCSEAGRETLEEKVTLLHCTTEYPAPFEEVNLRAMSTMRTAFGLSVGLSDHTPGIVVPIAAVALGAIVIEKHFTLDRNLPGPDHKASLEPDELKAMVTAIRNIKAAMGNGQKVPMSSELKNRDIARKSLVAAKQIYMGEKFSSSNLNMKRPGKGLSPMKYWELIGEISKKDYDTDELI
jgi:N-acetylneuraminate synthase